MTGPILTALLAVVAGLAGLLIGWLLATLRAVRTHAALLAELSQARAENQAAREKTEWSKAAEQQLRESFQALAAKSLQSNSESFVAQARHQLEAILKQMRGDWSAQKEQMGHLVQPVEKGLKALDDQVRLLEQRREGAYKTLEQHLGQLQTAHQQLRDETKDLKKALTASASTRGRWGEVQLRRIVEMSGMVNHVDFEEQQAAGDTRPDMIVHMPNEGVLPVDAKTPLQHYLNAVEADEEEARTRHLKAHAQAMRTRVRDLSSKAYWQQFERTPEVVVMFVPNEACLGAAFENEPGLIEYGLQQRVLIATPVTLFGLLKAITYGWQQQAIAENARDIALAGRELCDRLGVFLGHLSKAGKSLDNAVNNFNAAIGSAESRLLPSARRLRELGATTQDIEFPTPIDRQAHIPAEQE